MKIEIKITDENGNVQLYDVIPSLFTEEGIDKIFEFKPQRLYIGADDDKREHEQMCMGAKILLRRILEK